MLIKKILVLKSNYEKVYMIYVL